MLTFNRLVTLGCSFTYGEELSNPKEQAWPSQLSKNLRIPTLLNLGKSAYSNDQIMYDLLNLNFDQNEDLIVIGLTSYSRIYFEDDFNWITTIPNSFRNDKNAFINQIFKNVSTNFLIKRYLMQIIYMQEYLEKNNLKWLFFNALVNITEKDNVSKYENLIKKVNADKFYGWPYDNWQNIIGEDQTMPRGHPTFEQHKHLSIILENKLKLLYF